MATIRHAPALALALGGLLAAGSASAQSPAPIDPSPPKVGRSFTGTGQTKPPGATARTASAPLPKPATVTEMIKAQKAAEARSKAWDTRTRRTMGSICSGC